MTALADYLGMTHVDFSFFYKEKPLPGLCCIYLLPETLIVAHALQPDQKDKKDQKPTITFLETCSYEPNLLKFALENIVKKHALKGMTCSWVLHSSHYQLFLLDAPSVSEAEIPLALRWQIKELIDYPSENALIQYFPMPSTLAAKKKIYVAIAKTMELQAVSNIINDVGFDLKYIDITELALRNINALYNDDLCYLGLLAFHHDFVELIITHEKNFILSRRLALPTVTDAGSLSPEWLSNLIAEIQHSFVYAQSQHRKELAKKLLVLTTVPNLAIELNQLLNIPTEQLAIDKKINLEFVIPSNDYWSPSNLIAIGGALRSE